MNTVLIDLASLGFQLFAAIMALRLVRVTAHRPSWIIISVASMLQAVRRGLSLYNSIVVNTSAGSDPLDSIIALIISILMAVGITTIGPFFAKINRAEQELVRLNTEAGQQVDERTAELELAHERMERQDKLATIGRIAGSIGHELRNPLGAITNSVYYLNMKCPGDDERIKKHLGIIQEESIRATKIISDLLDFARTRPDESRSIDASELIGQTLEGMQMPGNVEVVTDFQPGIPRVTVDPSKLQQAFQNIITNACQAMPDGGRLAIGAKISGPSIEVTFNDTGVGISPENLPRLFEPLYTTKSKGIGLGLTIAKDIVEKYGGTIDVESELGVGSTFIVRIPAEGNGHETIEKGKSREGTPGQGPNMT